MKFPGWDVGASIDYIKSLPKCPSNWYREFIISLTKGGIKIGFFPKCPMNLYDEGFLIMKGFKFIDTYNTKESQDWYTHHRAIPGDIVVMESPFSDEGHVAIYDGDGWISPNIQKSMYAFGDNKNPITKTMNCYVFRWNSDRRGL